MKKRALPPGLPPAGEVPIDPHMPQPKPSADIPYICLRGQKQKAPTLIRCGIRVTKGGWTVYIKRSGVVIMESTRGAVRERAEQKLKNLIGQTWLIVADK